jgi:hypothetical protein
MPPQASTRKTEGERLSKVIEGIFTHDKRIRFVAIYQDQYQVAGGMRPGARSHDPEEEAREIDLQLAKVGEIARSWQRWFGNLVAFTIKYEKITLGFRPLAAGRFLVVSSEPGFDHASLEGVMTQLGYKAPKGDTS